jgi:transposase
LVFVMVMWPQAPRDVPVETVRMVRAISREVPFCVRLREALGPLFRDEDFGELFDSRGARVLAPGYLAAVSVLQFVEGLTDRQAAEQALYRIDWKYLLGVDLAHPGFDFTVLSDFRERLARDDAAERLVFHAVLERLADAGLVAPGGSQRIDSTHVLAAIRTLNRLELLGEALRAALESIAALDPAWLQSWAPPEWFTRYGPRVDNYRLPKDQAERDALAVVIGRDGTRVLAEAYAPTAPAYIRLLPYLQALRMIWLQQYYRDEHGIVLREKTEHGRPPGQATIVSPHDTDARYSTKRGSEWRGYKVQLNETCDQDLPHLVTYIHTTHAATGDIDSTTASQDSLTGRGLAPARQFGDSAYITAAHILHARARGIDLIGPVQRREAWQEKSPGAYGIDAFAIDWDQRTATCPQGHTSTSWGEHHGNNGKPVIKIHFSETVCAQCPARPLCTKGAVSPRSLNLQPRPHHELLTEQRRTQQTRDWQRLYNQRAGIEGTISQAVRAFGLRRCRYTGLAKTRVQHALTATAINLTRLDTWLTGTPLGHTRTSHMAQLTPTT